MSNLSIFHLIFIILSDLPKSTISLSLSIYIYIYSQLCFSLLLSFTQSFFLHQRKLVVFHWCLSDSKFPQVSRTLLSILAVLNDDVIWMVSSRPSISKSSSPFSNFLVTVPKAAITIGIIVTLSVLVV